MTDTPKALVPWIGVAVAAIALITMVVASVMAWPEMAESIVTREARGDNGASIVPRGFAAIGVPTAFAIVIVLLAIVPVADRALRSRVGLPGAVNARGAVRVLNYVVSGLSVFFVVFHLGLLSQYTGSAFPFEQAVPAAGGLVVVMLGIALPLARPDDTFGSATLERVRRAVSPGYRAAGFALVAVGLLTIGAAFIWAPAALVVMTVGILGAIALGIAAAVRYRPATGATK